MKNKTDLEIIQKLVAVLKTLQEKQCDMHVVSKRFIELTRDDLVKIKSDLPINEICFYDFKSSSMTREELLKAEKITFKDGDEMKVLKSRY